MDSISQMALGSAVAIVATGGRQPVKAIIAGATLGTLPDLDVLIPFETDLEATIRHRSWSHSWIVHLLIAPLLGLLLHKVTQCWSWKRASWLVVTVLISHSALDALTIYGTWLFWPLGNQPVMGGSIFIIDPLYTLPLLVCVIMTWRRRRLQVSSRFAWIGLIVSTSYLGWGLFAKSHIESFARAQFQSSSAQSFQLVATPTPFNSLLWRILVIDGPAFSEAFYSFTDRDKKLDFNHLNRGTSLLEKIDDTRSIYAFSNFNHGYYALSRDSKGVLGQDLRMGSEPYFFFQFRFAEIDIGANSPHVQFKAVPAMYSTMKIEPVKLFGWLAKRLIYEDLPPIKSTRALP